MSAVFNGVTCEVTALASIGARPICPPAIDVIGIAGHRRANVTMEISTLLPFPSAACETGIAHRRWRNFRPTFRRFPFDLWRACILRRHGCDLRRSGLGLGIANCGDPFDELAFLRLSKIGVATHFEKTSSYRWSPSAAMILPSVAGSAFSEVLQDRQW